MDLEKALERVKNGRGKFACVHLCACENVCEHAFEHVNARVSVWRTGV